jgi:uncharacterized protein YqgV (UPF0045/DUF77 family)
MKTSIEISYYPLSEKYVPPIHQFINRLRKYSEISLETNGMSTQVFGDYDELMFILTKEIRKSMEIPSSVFILKLVNVDLQIHPNSYE